MKKIVLFICTLICTNLLMAQTRFTIGSITYEVIDSNEVKIYDYSGTDSVLVIPDTVAYQNVSYAVTEIGEYALEYSQSLITVTIPNSVRIINDGAFSFCSNLSYAIIPDSITSIEYATFYNCSSLNSIVIPNSVISIGNSAFYGCSSLDSVIIPNSVTSIEISAFHGCSSLVYITIPGAITSIADDLFGDCRKLNYIPISNSITSIGRYAFGNCDSLISVHIPNSVTSIGPLAFENCSNLTSIILPSSLTTIELSTFANCTSLASIVIPNTATSIGKYAFQNCYNLASVTLPDSLNNIDDYAFQNCYNLPNITIPSAICSIGVRAFDNCSNLSEVISLSNIPPSIKRFCFTNISDTTVLKVPCHTNEYASSNWANYFDTIQVIEGSGFYITANVNNSDWGTVEIENNCTDSTTLTATSNNCHYQFQQWNDGNTDNPRTILLYQDTSFTAIFDSVDDYDIHIYDTICEGETYTDNDFYAIQTGVYTRRLIPSIGCDSVVTLHLTVNQHTTGIDTVEACNSYTWIDGITYAQSTNRPTYTLTNSGGCDSIVTLNLTILECIYNVTVNVFNNDTTGTVIGSGQYMHGDTATIMALANNGFHFVQWKDGSVENPRKVVVTSDTTFSAIFGANPPVAINDSKQLESLTLHPNPTTGIITFNRTDVMKVEVLDAVGRMVMAVENKHIIDLSKLSQGYYTLRVALPEGVAVRKVIKQ